VLINDINASSDLNSEEMNASKNVVLDTLQKKINVFLAMTPTAMSATLKINAKPARLLTY